MAWVGFPIDVVVIHRADHVAIHECRVDRVGLEAGNECGGLAIAATHGAMMLEQDLCVVLLAPT
jgi:hypothetical protein